MVLTKCSTRTRSDREGSPVSLRMKEGDELKSLPVEERKQTRGKERRTDGKITWEKEGTERYGEEENGEETRENHTRCGEGERRYSYIVITRRARSTAGCQRCLGARNEKATQGERGVAEYDYVETTREREEQREGEECCAEEEVPRVASRHKRLYDRRSSDR